MSRVARRRDNDLTGPISALCRLATKIRIQGRQVQKDGLQSLTERLAKEAAKLFGGQKVPKENNERGSSSSSTSEESVVGKRPGQRTRPKREGPIQYEEIEGSGRSKAECRESDAAFCAARRAESSSRFDAPGEIGARGTYSKDYSLAPVIEMTRPTTWRENLIANWCQFVRAI